jgi:hypothetical protein
MLALLCALSPASATDPAPAHVLPTTTSVTRGTAEVSVSAAGGYAVGASPVGAGGSAVAGGLARVGYAPADGLWIEATAGGMTAGVPAAVVSLSAGWSLVRGPRVSTGPVLMAPVYTAEAPGAVVPNLLVGWSATGTIGPVRMDGTLAVGGVVSGPRFGPGVGPYMFALETGVSFPLDPQGVHVLRTGAVLAAVGSLPIAVPDVAYRFEGERWFFEAATGGIVYLQGARFEVGARF